MFLPGLEKMYFSREDSYISHYFLCISLLKNTKFPTKWSHFPGRSFLISTFFPTIQCSSYISSKVNWNMVSCSTNGLASQPCRECFTHPNLQRHAQFLPTWPRYFVHSQLFKIYTSSFLLYTPKPSNPACQRSCGGLFLFCFWKIHITWTTVLLLWNLGL